MNKIKTLIFLLFVSTSILAQEVEIPHDLKLEKAEDYQKTEKLVLNSTDWLLNTPVSENPEKRKEINAFLMKWMNGSLLLQLNWFLGLFLWIVQIA